MKHALLPVEGKAACLGLLPSTAYNSIISNDYSALNYDMRMFIKCPALDWNPEPKNQKMKEMVE